MKFKNQIEYREMHETLQVNEKFELNNQELFLHLR